MVHRTVSQYDISGIAALHIEDQVVTKRCGHIAGKQIVLRETYIARIRAAAAARASCNSDLVLIARTDCLRSLGHEEGIKRLQLARSAGADVAFFEGLTSKEMVRRALHDLAPMPCLLNMVELGFTPAITASEAQEMGFRIIINPLAALGPAYRAVRMAFEKLMVGGSVETGGELSPKQLFEVCGLHASMKIDAEAGGVDYSNGV
jgi:2-methylisocitrate lyase-like PEP mutase family enzyme